MSTDYDAVEPKRSTEREAIDDDSITDLLSILQNDRRRVVLDELAFIGHDDWLTLDELTDRLAACEFGRPPAQITSAERKRVYVSLYQTHVPRLADVGLIETRDRKTELRLTVAGHAAHRLLPHARTTADAVAELRGESA